MQGEWLPCQRPPPASDAGSLVRFALCAAHFADTQQEAYAAPLLREDFESDSGSRGRGGNGV
jgi:hypothetical protein